MEKEEKIRELVCAFMADTDMLNINQQFTPEELDNTADFCTEVCVFVMDVFKNIDVCPTCDRIEDGGICSCVDF